MRLFFGHFEVAGIRSPPKAGRPQEIPAADQEDPPMIAVQPGIEQVFP